MNISLLTEEYIESHPSIKDCVRKKLVNYSQLSRQVISENSLNPSDFDAVLIACRRYFRKISKAAILEDRIISLLSQSKIEVKTKMAVVVLYKAASSDERNDVERKARKQESSFYAIEGSNAITLVVASELLDEIKARFKSAIKKSWKDLAIVIIRSPEGQQDTTPGFISFITSKISYRGINILEIMSCWSETLFVVAEADIARVLDALKFK